MTIVNKLVFIVVVAIMVSFATTSTVSAKVTHRAHSSRPLTSHTSTTHTTPARTWSSTTHYGSTRSSHTGTSPLHSSTTPPAPHTYSGTTYNSSQAIYTNTSGFWVYYWLMRGNQVQCFDQNHKRISCDRNDKSYSKDW